MQPGWILGKVGHFLEKWFLDHIKNDTLHFMLCLCYVLTVPRIFVFNIQQKFTERSNPKAYIQVKHCLELSVRKTLLSSV